MAEGHHVELLDRHEALLVTAGYPGFLGMTKDRFHSAIESLRSRLKDLPDLQVSGNVPLCIAFRPRSLNLRAAMAAIRAKSAAGVVEMTPLAPDDFEIIDEVAVPEGDIYLLVDVDTGRNFLNVSPEKSLIALRAQGRTPLTLEEGVALTAQFPELLTDKLQFNCIQMPGSRKPSDQRVPSIWFSKGAPRLGWCWDRNIHTWLGTASAAYRLGSS